MTTITTLQDLDSTKEEPKKPHVYKFKTIADLNDLELEITTLENNIQTFIHNDNKCFCKFKYVEHPDSTIELKVYTINPLHNEVFLMTKSVEISKKKCLERTLFYLKKSIKSKKMFTYAVEWMKAGDSKNTVSYFWVNGIPELMEKFYEGEEKNIYDYTIYNIHMRPES